VVAIGLAGATVAGCRSNGSPDIVVAAVGRATVVEVVEAPASAVAKGTATVSSPASGTVAVLKVRDGQRVRAGHLIMVIDSPQAQEALKQAEQAQASASSVVSFNPIDVAAQQQRADSAAARAFDVARQAARAIPTPAARAQALAQVARAQAQFTAASQQAATALEQINSGASSVAAAINSLSSAQQTQANLAVRVAQRVVAGLRVKAPISGLVALGTGGGSSSSSSSSLLDSLPSILQGQAQSLLGSPGSTTSTTGTLQAGSPVTSGSPLLTVTDTSQLTLQAQVDETDVLLVHSGVKADVQFDAVPGATYHARVLSTDVNPTTSSRGGVAYPVRLTLDVGTYSDGRVAPRPLPGMSAVAALRVRTAVDAVAVPASAVFRDGAQDDVWLVTGGTAHKHAVTLGAQGEAEVQVLAGLSEGDQVVVHGADQVHEGQSVP